MNSMSSSQDPPLAPNSTSKEIMLKGQELRFLPF